MQQIFSEWYSKHFWHSVLQFCTQNTLPQKALLLVDNVPGHPPNLEDVKSELEVKIVFLPTNTTSLLQPMDQGVIAAFKAYYLHQSLQEMIQQMDTSGVSLKEYWKDYHILKATYNIKMVWEEVTVSCVKGMWHKICPSNENYGTNCCSLDMLIKEIAGEVFLDSVDHVCVTEVLESHSQPLSNEELYDVAQQLTEQQKEDEDEEDRGTKEMQ